MYNKQFNYSDPLASFFGFVFFFFAKSSDKIALFGSKMELHVPRDISKIEVICDNNYQYGGIEKHLSYKKIHHSFPRYSCQLSISTAIIMIITVEACNCSTAL